MRTKIINYFIDDPEDVTLSQELGFYAVISSPIIIFMIFLILV